MSPFEEILPAIFESPVLGILCASHDGTLRYCNQTAARLFGYSREELTGAQVESLLPEARRAAHARRRLEYQSAPVVRPMGVGVELSGRRKDGSEFPVEVSLSSAQTAEGPIVVAFVADITARRELERSLALSQKMEALGLLSAGLAHDFNNLLTVIVTHLDESAGRMAADDPLRSSAEAALVASQQAARLVAQLFAFARRPEHPPASLNVNLLLSDQAGLLRRVAGPEVELILQLDSEPCAALVEGAELERALVNLVANARDATAPGGWILIETSRVELEHAVDPAAADRKRSPYVLVAVSDNGRGMSREVQDRLFEPFFTNKARDRGAGLGLALVYAAVKHVGGEIRVHSEPGRGTSFKLFLPASGAADERFSRQPMAQAEHCGTVLVVDDQQAVREMCSAMLRTLGYKALVAPGGREAISFSQEHEGRIDVLLTDVLMPGMNGPDLALAIAGQRPGIRVVYMSGYTAGTIGLHHLVDARAAFLSKPFTLDQLRVAVAERGRERGWGSG